MSNDIITKGELKEIKDVKPLENYTLLLTFNNGEKRIFDVKPYLEHKIYKRLKNKELFNKVHIIYDYTIAWNNEIDMCPDSIYRDSIPCKEE